MDSWESLYGRPDQGPHTTENRTIEWSVAQDPNSWAVGIDVTDLVFNEGIETAALHLETMGLKTTAREIRDLKRGVTQSE